MIVFAFFGLFTLALVVTQAQKQQSTSSQAAGTPLTITGKVARSLIENNKKKVSTNNIMVVTKEGAQYTLSGSLPTLISGSTVQVSGTVIGTTLSVSSKSNVSVTKTMAIAKTQNVIPTTGTDTVMVLPFLLPRDPYRTAPMPSSDIKKHIFDDPEKSAANFYSVMSGGWTNPANAKKKITKGSIPSSQTVGVHEWFTIDDLPEWYDSNGQLKCDKYAEISNAANTFLTNRENFNPMNYTFIVYYFPALPHCDQFGGITWDNYPDPFAPPRIWLNPAYYSPRVPAHEMGHLYGLGHANVMDCSPTQIAALGACKVTEGENNYDVMGWKAMYPGSMSGVALERLGWANITTIDDDPSLPHRLIDLVDAKMTQHVLKMQKLNTSEYYYLTAVNKTLFDGANPDLDQYGGIFFNMAGRDDRPGNGFPYVSNAIDIHPNDTSSKNAYLASSDRYPGTSALFKFCDKDNYLSVYKAFGQGDQVSTMDINFTNSTCIPNPGPNGTPTPRLSPTPTLTPTRTPTPSTTPTRTPTPPTTSKYVRRSFISLNGDRYFQQTCPFINGAPDATCASSKPWRQFLLSGSGSIGAPRSTSQAYTTFLFPGDTSLRQSFIDTAGNGSFFRTCSFSKSAEIANANNNTLPDPITACTGSDTGWKGPYTIPAITPSGTTSTFSTFGGYTVIIFPNTSNQYAVRRSFISVNGDRYFQQTCPFVNGAPDGTCASSKPWRQFLLSGSGSIGAPRSTSQAYTTFLFPGNSSLRQSFIDEVGKANFFRTCSFSVNTESANMYNNSIPDPITACTGSDTGWKGPYGLTPITPYGTSSQFSTFGGYTVIIF